MDAIFVQLATGALSGIGSWCVGRFLNWLMAKRAEAKRARPLPGPAQPAPSAATAIPGWQARGASAAGRPPAPSVSFAQILIQAGILTAAANAVPFAAGFAYAALAQRFGVDVQSASASVPFLLSLLLISVVTFIYFFYIFGIGLDRAVRWLHLTYVALATAVLSVVVYVLMKVVWYKQEVTVGGTIVGVIIAVVEIFVAMSIGGGLATIFGPKSRPLPPQQYAPPAMPPTVPYSRGAPQSAAPPAAPPFGPPAPHASPAPYHPEYPPQAPGQAPGGYQAGAGHPPPAGGPYSQTPYQGAPYPAPPYPPGNDK